LEARGLTGEVRCERSRKKTEAVVQKTGHGRKGRGTTGHIARGVASTTNRPEHEMWMGSVGWGENLWETRQKTLGITRLSRNKT